MRLKNDLTNKDLPKRAIRVLKENDIHNLEDLLRYDENSLMRLSTESGEVLPRKGMHQLKKHIRKIYPHRISSEGVFLSKKK